MIGIEEQLEGIRLLEKAYICYVKEGDFAYHNELYEKGFALIRAVVGIKKLTEISWTTSGTKENIRKEQIKYMFDNCYKNTTTNGA